jgi:hypothetical protein
MSPLQEDADEHRGLSFQSGKTPWDGRPAGITRFKPSKIFPPMAIPAVSAGCDFLMLHRRACTNISEDFTNQ